MANTQKKSFEFLWGWKSLTGCYIPPWVRSLFPICRTEGDYLTEPPACFSLSEFWGLSLARFYLRDFVIIFKPTKKFCISPA